MFNAPASVHVRHPDGVWSLSATHSQWSAQELVKQVHALLQKKGVPVWMDISGGMTKDIYDSVRTLASVFDARVSAAAEDYCCVLSSGLLV